MRLYNVNTLTFQRFYSNPPPYVIASHRWAHEDEEITYQDVLASRNTERIGYKKLNSFVTYVKSQHRDVDWLWIDTCCIDKTNAVELSEAINSMYKWYRNAEICLAYLSDVLYPKEENAPASNLEDFAKLFRQSDWFTRGWTLQELVAPKIVVFLTADWEVIGYKGERTQRGPFRALEEAIAAITRIPRHVLDDASTLDSVSVETRLQWASERETTREEDQWYCLYSLLDAPIGANYGEGVKRARRRLLADLEESGSIKPGRAAAIAHRLDAAGLLQQQRSNSPVAQFSMTFPSFTNTFPEVSMLLPKPNEAAEREAIQQQQYAQYHDQSLGPATAYMSSTLSCQSHYPSLQSLLRDEGSVTQPRVKIVIENIPYVVKKQDLLAFMSDKGLVVPRDMHYRFDNGSFRGKADASFSNKADAVAAVQKLNNTELNGRKLRVDYAASAAWQRGAERTHRDVLRGQHLTPEMAYQTAIGGSPLLLLRESGELEYFTGSADAHASRNASETSPGREPILLPNQTPIGREEDFDQPSQKNRGFSLPDEFHPREQVLSSSQNPASGRQQDTDQSSETSRGLSCRIRPRQPRREPSVYPSPTFKPAFTYRQP
ncbi:hypothetical protein LTR95_002942 [Oleoguttula sp. CCFEE 5521]